jgi:hypothetical protein
MEIIFRFVGERIIHEYWIKLIVFNEHLACSFCGSEDIANAQVGIIGQKKPIAAAAMTCPHSLCHFLC